MTLKNWSICCMDDNFIAPELRENYSLRGRVYGHPRFEDGKGVITSSIVEVRDKREYKEVLTRSGSVYTLFKEDVSPECEALYPNYYERLCLTIC